MRRTTPRDVKRFVNRLRFLAMRLRDIDQESEKAGRKAPLDESTLVSFAAIEDLDTGKRGGPNPEQVNPELFKLTIQDERSF